MITTKRNTILLTGATGYIGGRLLPCLVETGRPVRLLVRDPARLHLRERADVELVVGDLMNPDTLAPALKGVHTAYYLVHSMETGGDFEAADRRAAENFAAAARAAGVCRIIYLGGLGHDGEGLSTHLRSRQEVGEVLRRGGVPVVELRASIVIGAGSLSFEMIRALVERLPLMVTPRWVEVTTQPIAIGDLLLYLRQALDLPMEGSAVYEIGGAEQTSYGGLMREYARLRGLRRAMIPVPVLTPRLSSLWLALVTPVYAQIGRKLIASIRYATVVRDERASRFFAVSPRDVQSAITDALSEEDARFADNAWQEAHAAVVPRGWGGRRIGTRLLDAREARSPQPPAKAFAPIRRIGGRRGWLYVDWLWRARGLLDRLIGGPGMRRGRRDPEWPQVGDPIDCWRVEAMVPDRRLRLRAEMRLPGRMWLEFEVLPAGKGSRVRQIAVFDAHGLLGLLYWYLVWPFHQFVFAGLLRRLVLAAGEVPPLDETKAQGERV
jgi:uncharacterized protein YbjT (DUF2867 family)